jgi:hypothetical protein
MKQSINNYGGEAFFVSPGSNVLEQLADTSYGFQYDSSSVSNWQIICIKLEQS